MKYYSKKIDSIRGDLSVPGDKSISHRSLILGSIADGITKVSGLLEGEDVLCTLRAMQMMGVKIEREGDSWVIYGNGIKGLVAPSDVIDMGNSGTAVRLLMGLVSSYDFPVFFTGDESLRSRPMARVIVPLEKTGANFTSSDNKLPLVVKGNKLPAPLEYNIPVASAQVKSAIILAALGIKGKTKITELKKTRDHTELMLKSFGAELEINGNEITINGLPDLKGQDIAVPGDPSSAAFLVVAALITKNSEVVIRNICMNPNRTGLFNALIRMGADIKFTNKKESAGENIADILVKSSNLKAIDLESEIAPSMIDEYPILAIAASCAEGKTRLNGLEELKVKESNRLSAIAEGLENCGVKVQLGDDSLTIEGGEVSGGSVRTFHDHRIAMSFLVLGMVCKNGTEIDDFEMVKTSFPGFDDILNSLGAKIHG